MKSKLLLLSMVLLPTFVPSWGTAQSEISTGDFSCAIPESMSQTRATTPEIPVLLGSPAGYPTFNVVVSSTRYDARTIDIDRHSQRTLEEYRKIGLTDAAISGVESASIGELTLPVVKIRYSLNGVKYQAAVAYVPATTKHFVLTYIDLQDTYHRNRTMLDTIYLSFRVAENQKVAPVREADKTSAGSLVFISLGLLVAGSLFYLAVRKLYA